MHLFWRVNLTKNIGFHTTSRNINSKMTLKSCENKCTGVSLIFGSSVHLFWRANLTPNEPMAPKLMQMDTKYLKTHDIYIHAYTRIYTHIHACTRIYTHLHACTRIYTHIHAYTRIYARIYGHIDAYSRLRTHIYTYTRIFRTPRACPIEQSDETSVITEPFRTPAAP